MVLFCSVFPHSASPASLEQPFTHTHITKYSSTSVRSFPWLHRSLPLFKVTSGSVIVYDLASQTIRAEKAEECKDQKAKLFTAPRFSNHVNLWADDTRLIARLDLDKLGWGTTMKRWFGKINQIQMVRPQ